MGSDLANYQRELRLVHASNVLPQSNARHRNTFITQVNGHIQDGPKATNNTTINLPAKIIQDEHLKLRYIDQECLKLDINVSYITIPIC